MSLEKAIKEEIDSIQIKEEPVYFENENQDNDIENYAQDNANLTSKNQGTERNIKEEIDSIQIKEEQVDVKIENSNYDMTYIVQDYVNPTCNYPGTEVVGIKVEEYNISNSKLSNDELIDDASYFCSQCNENFDFKSELILHLKFHAGDQQFLCRHCYICFNKWNMLAHLKLQVADKRKSREGKEHFYCNMCGKMFSTTKNLNSHAISHIEGHLFNCNLCLVCFVDTKGLVDHVKEHKHSAKSYPCRNCAVCFSNQFDLKAHITTTRGRKEHKCVHCCISFDTLETLLVHNVEHNTKYPFRCHKCKKLFIKIAKLEKHMGSHIKGEPFACGICNKSFVSINTLDIHIQSHSANLI